MTLLVVAATERELRGVPDDIEQLICGVGPVDAAVAVTRRLARGDRPGALLHVGIAGVRRGAAIPLLSTVIGTSSIWIDTSHHLVSRHLTPDPALLAAITVALPAAHASEIATSAEVNAAQGFDVEAMEGFGVLRAAAAFDVPAIELRVISNELDEVDRAKWHFDDAFAALAHVTPAACNAIRSSRD